MDARMEFAIDVARSVGDILREGYHQQKTIRLKGVRDLVTEFDLQSEEYILEQIREKFPGDAVLAEEGGRLSGTNGKWVIDPLDGTTNFAHGIPFFCVSIAYILDGETQLGVILDPMRDECFHAMRGNGAWLGDVQLQVSSSSVVEESVLGTSYTPTIEGNPENILSRYSYASKQARAVRRLGSAALDLAYVAAGRFDGYWATGLFPWDWAAGMLIVKEAGGRMSRIDGGEEVVREPTSLLASNKFIHNDLLSIFKQADE